MVKNEYMDVLKAYINAMREQIKLWEEIRKKLLAETTEQSPKVSKCNNADKIAEIVAYLNAKAGTHYRANSDVTARLINARLADGFTVADFKKVIDNMTAEWKNDGKMQIYLRPVTLFGTKFESYLNAQTVHYKGPRALVGNTDIERREYAQQDYDAIFTPLDDLLEEEEDGTN